jgi:hypothetical protein
MIDNILSKKGGVFLIHAFIGWFLCGATMMIGLEVTSENNAILIHLIAAPIYFGVITYVYTRKFNYTTPIQTAIGFIAFVILMDFFIVAPIFEQSYEMFYNPLGTWIPFLLSFIATYVIGTFVSKQKLSMEST